jgi:hypothetical protein
MITIEKIKNKAEAYYYKWLERIADHDAPYAPLVLTRIADDGSLQEDRLALMAELIDHSKKKLGQGYWIEIESSGGRGGRVPQSKIKKITFETQEDLLFFLDKTAAFDAFNATLVHIRAVAPYLREWTVKQVKMVEQNTEIWPALLAVVLYFRKNPSPGVPQRLLPIEGIDTKFIGNNNALLCSLIDATIPPDYVDKTYSDFERRYKLKDKEPFIHCYFNDPKLVAHYHGFTSLAFPAHQLAQRPQPVETVIIVENSHSPQQLLQHELPNTMIIFGGGYGVAVLKEAHWLRDVRLLYWGDLDTHGLAILSKVRSYFPNVQSFLMDEGTFETYQDYVVTDKPFKGEAPSYLTAAEKSLFALLKENGLRLEQERVREIGIVDKESTRTKLSKTVN